MPVTYKIDAGARVIRTRCAGNLTLREVIEHFGQLADDPELPDELDVVLDLSEVESLPLTNQLVSLNSVLRAIRKRVGFGAIAIIAQRDALYGMMRIFEVTSQNYFRAIRVFRDPVEAERWIAAQS